MAYASDPLVRAIANIVTSSLEDAKKYVEILRLLFIRPIWTRVKGDTDTPCGIAFTDKKGRLYFAVNIYIQDRTFTIEMQPVEKSPKKATIPLKISRGNYPEEVAKVLANLDYTIVGYRACKQKQDTRNAMLQQWDVACKAAMTAYLDNVANIANDTGSGFTPGIYDGEVKRDVLKDLLVNRASLASTGITFMNGAGYTHHLYGLGAWLFDTSGKPITELADALAGLSTHMSTMCLTMFTEDKESAPIKFIPSDDTQKDNYNFPFPYIDDKESSVLFKPLKEGDKTTPLHIGVKVYCAPYLLDTHDVVNDPRSYLSIRDFSEIIDGAGDYLFSLSRLSPINVTFFGAQYGDDDTVKLEYEDSKGNIYDLDKFVRDKDAVVRKMWTTPPNDGYGHMAFLLDALSIEWQFPYHTDDTYDSLIKTQKVLITNLMKPLPQIAARNIRLASRGYQKWYGTSGWGNYTAKHLAAITQRPEKEEPAPTEVKETTTAEGEATTVAFGGGDKPEEEKERLVALYEEIETESERMNSDIEKRKKEAKGYVDARWKYKDNPDDIQSILKSNLESIGSYITDNASDANIVRDLSGELEGFRSSDLARKPPFAERWTNSTDLLKAITTKLENEGNRLAIDKKTIKKRVDGYDSFIKSLHGKAIAAEQIDEQVKVLRGNVSALSLLASTEYVRSAETLEKTSENLEKQEITRKELESETPDFSDEEEAIIETSNIAEIFGGIFIPESTKSILAILKEAVQNKKYLRDGGPLDAQIKEALSKIKEKLSKLSEKAQREKARKEKTAKEEASKKAEKEAEERKAKAEKEASEEEAAAARKAKAEKEAKEKEAERKRKEREEEEARRKAKAEEKKKKEAKKKPRPSPPRPTPKGLGSPYTPASIRRPDKLEDESSKRLAATTNAKITHYGKYYEASSSTGPVSVDLSNEVALSTPHLGYKPLKDVVIDFRSETQGSKDLMYISVPYLYAYSNTEKARVRGFSAFYIIGMMSGELVGVPTRGFYHTRLDGRNSWSIANTGAIIVITNTESREHMQTYVIQYDVPYVSSVATNEVQALVFKDVKESKTGTGPRTFILGVKASETVSNQIDFVYLAIKA